MKRLLRLGIFMMTILLLNTGLAEPSGAGNIATVSPGLGIQPDTAAVKPLDHLCNLLASAKKGDLSFCLGYIKNSKDSNHDIANFILTWSPDAYRKEIPSIFRSKIDRVVKKLGSIDYEQLIIDIDFIKNSQLTVSQMVRLIKRTRLSVAKVK